MLQNPRKTLGFKKNMVYKIPPGGGGKPYPASGLLPFTVKRDYNRNLKVQLIAVFFLAHLSQGELLVYQ